MPTDCTTNNRWLDNSLIFPYNVSIIYADIAGDDFGAKTQRDLGFNFYLKT